MKATEQSKTKSKSLMNCSDRVNNECLMTAEDICRIVETCGKSGVAAFKYNGLELKYSNETPRIEFVSRGTDVIAGVTEPTELSPNQKQELSSYDEDNLALIDPVEHERKIMMDMQEGTVDATAQSDSGI